MKIIGPDALHSWVATRSNMNKHLPKCLQAEAMNVHSRHKNTANESQSLFMIGDLLLTCQIQSNIILITLGTDALIIASLKPPCLKSPRSLFPILASVRFREL